MCRHAAYIGPGIALSELMSDLDHSLHHQSFQARELLTGTVCADGFGIAWYDPDTRPEPARYASILPIWNDINLASFGPVIRSNVVMGAVRNATVPGSLDVANCAPLVAGNLSLSLNGYLMDHDASWKDALQAGWMDPDARRAIKGSTDAEAILAVIATRIKGTDGTDASTLATVAQSTLRDLLAYAAEHGLDAQLDLLLSDGDQVIATRAGNEAKQNSLYHLSDGEEFPGAHVVASEPLYDDALWAPVAEDTVLVLRADSPPVRLKV